MSVVLTTKVSVTVEKVIVPVLDIVEIIGAVIVLFINICVPKVMTILESTRSSKVNTLFKAGFVETLNVIVFTTPSGWKVN